MTLPLTTITPEHSSTKAIRLHAELYTRLAMGVRRAHAEGKLPAAKAEEAIDLLREHFFSLQDELATRLGLGGVA